MRKFRWLLMFPIVFVGLVLFASTGWGAENLVSIVAVQKYSRAIHIMAMLLVGFGFLMVFIKKYGRSAVTATYLLVSTAIPLYMLINSMGIFGDPQPFEIDRLILAEFAAASLLICAGAMLGRLKMIQYIILGILFIPCYMLNEWILTGGGLGLMSQGITDTGGSILIHAFGAFFGLGVVITMTTLKEFETPIKSSVTSDQFSMLGSMVLWLFWPSFCAALVVPKLVPLTVVNVVIALCGATVATYFVSVALRRKISIADIANASLAGGVAIGSVCDYATHGTSFIIGILAGALSTYSFVVLLPKFQNIIKKVDTCGVMNLHGLPGLMGGIAAIFVVKGISNTTQLSGIAIMLVIALATGFITGKILALFGRRTVPYVDAEEFVDVET
ncbi:MAG: ammonium transporter [Candidatus Saganbacteria bacterium]|nr:ammonium transporter [Candidatus Saganbacteria bacterium]